MTIKIINKSNNPLPRYESAQAAGMDIRCNIPEAITLQPLERKLIPTGLFIELPVGYEAQIRPRSGLAAHPPPACGGAPHDVGKNICRNTDAAHEAFIIF